MSVHHTPDDFRTVLSIDPLLDFWREKVAPQCTHMAAMFDVFEKWIEETPALQGDIDRTGDCRPAYGYSVTIDECRLSFLHLGD
jgi:hypothetical protein